MSCSAHSLTFMQTIPRQHLCQEKHVLSCRNIMRPHADLKIDRNKRNKVMRENECWHLHPTSYFLTLVWTQSKSKSYLGFLFFLHQLCVYQWQMADWLFQRSQVAFCLQTNMFLLRFHYISSSALWEAVIGEHQTPIIKGIWWITANVLKVV